tara:strand:- start:1156 stop:1926 length:771 start_codon:yes stop_codon:yes gene_type:complete
MRSPLKDKDGFTCVDAIHKLLPADSRVKSFLFFSGNLELGLERYGRTVETYTNKYVTFEFWKCASKDPYNIIHKAEWLNERMDLELIYTFQEKWPLYKDPFVRSALFFLLNIYSHKGRISSGHFSMENYNPISVGRLKNLYNVDKKINILYHEDENYLDCFDQLETREEDVLVLPVGNFSHNWLQHGTLRGFEDYVVNHKDLKEKLKEKESKFILCYKPHRELYDFYSDFNIKLLNKYGIETENLENCHDVLIYNF